MKFELTVAQRFAFPKAQGGKAPTFIATVAALGVTLGTAALILALSVLSGFTREIESKLIGFGAHLQLSHAAFRELLTSEIDTNKIKSVQNIAALSPFLQRSVILKSKGDSVESALEPATLKGIVPETDVSFIRRKMIAGNFFADSPTEKSLPIVVGKKMAQKLAVNVGDELLVIASSKDLQPDSWREKSAVDALKALHIESARVVGMFETGMSQGHDDVVVFTRLDAMQTFLDLNGQLTGYEATVKDVTLIQQTTAETNKLFKFPIVARSVYELNQNIFAWMKLQENIVPLLLLVITIVAAFNIVSTLLIMILEKRGEIGIVMSFGGSRKSVRGIFVSQAAVIAVLGVLLGNVLALVLTLIEKQFHLISLPQETYYISQVPLAIEPTHYLAVSLISVLISFAASFVPASSAAKLNPVEAIRS